MADTFHLNTSLEDFAERIGSILNTESEGGVVRRPYSSGSIVLHLRDDWLEATGVFALLKVDGEYKVFGSYGGDNTSYLGRLITFEVTTVPNGIDVMAQCLASVTPYYDKLLQQLGVRVPDAGIGIDTGGVNPDENYDAAYEEMKSKGLTRKEAFEWYLVLLKQQEISFYKIDVPQLSEKFRKAMKRREVGLKNVKRNI